MDELVVTAEILGGLLLLVAITVSLLLMRRGRIARGGLMVLMSLHRGDRWRAGMARVGVSDIAWYPLFGARIRPTEQWERGHLVLGAPQEPTHRPATMGDPVLVAFDEDGARFDVLLGRADYTAVRSWSESAPPGLNANNVA